MKKKVLAMILALCMVISMLPATVFAAHNGEELTRKMVPTTVGELEPAAVEPNAKTYAVKLTGEGNGEVELLVDTPAAEGSEVYFVANPDDGYLAEIYYEGLDEDALVYVGADVVGFIMPANKVTLEVRFVAAEGDNHSVSVFDYGHGQYALSRDRAKQYESVLLAVAPDDNSSFDPFTHVYVSRGVLFYLFEEEGIHYYEIIMPDDFVTVTVAYEKVGPNRIGMVSEPQEGKVTIEPDKAYFLDTVTVTIEPYPGYRLVRAVASSHAGEFNSELTPIGNDKYTFIMPAESVELYVTFESVLNSITVTAGPGGTASASVTEAMVGDTVTVTCTPDEGNKVASITGVEGLVDNGDNTYSFVMPDHAVALDVTFKKLYEPITVTVDTGLGGTAVTDVAEAKAGDTVTLICTPEEGYRIALVTGAELTDNGDGTYTFTMPDKPVELHVLFLRHENPFLDVNEKQFFYTPVLWAVENGITSGMTDTTFGPYASCNRAQVVTFLWRAAGSPEPTGTENPFTDVPEGKWYTKAVLWAVENGITNGLTADTFGPGEVCNRAQVVTFLWRAHGKTEPAATENPFEDVFESGFYYKAVLWALENGITTGADATHFNPNGTCMRGHVVTFLYRAAQIPAPEPEPDPTDPTEPEEPTDPTDPTEPEEPTQPAETYGLTLKYEGNGKVAYAGEMEAAAGESLFFYAVPDEGWYLSQFTIFDPNNDIGQVLVYAHENNMYEIVMPARDAILTAIFLPIEG